ncbi:Uncharacterized membrane protein YcaP, DUF421 family [Geosporobacter subterraneus DSM 17957]|uniref:Uncharacterized membrane protein YcaP, DUF421 family n=1 Tax=Geosporobacter subterraneus DSM 17957 TaxID=1121919 RepID=A0A1M6PPW7_9FIRM|nr:DUF421 domain-containing protein [Geosporobacter subterraneus]SHK09967.1 Uncharacterized membrane protein YcaP, DUF421 family [Geosporobacter subterraneus DSM 17957]
MKEWIEVLLRTVGLFIVIFAAIKILGNNAISKISSFRLISYIIIAIVTALLSANVIKNISLGLLVLAVWILLPLALEYLSLKSKYVHDLVYGKGKVVIKQGKVMEDQLKQARMTGEELLSELRSKNAFFMADVEFAIMEANGEINVLLKSDKLPITSKAMGQKVAPKSEPQTIILDGNVIHEGLKNLALNEKWLQQQLETAGIALENVFIGQVDSSGELYIDTFDDMIQLPQPTVKELLYANLEKSHSDLLGYSLETKDQQTKNMYEQNAKKLDEILKKLEPYLLR